MIKIGKIKNVLVLGDIMRDTIVIPEGKMVVGSDVRAKISTKPGGSGANQSLWLANNNVEVSFIARVGFDDLKYYQNMFATAGIGTHFSADNKLSTGHLVTIVDKNGERSFFTDRGANINLSLNDISENIFDNISLFHLSAYSLFEPSPREVALELIASAKQKNIGFSVDPASASFLGEIGVEKFLGWTKGAALFFPNEEEAEFLSGSSDLEQQMDFLTQYYQLVIIKLGSKGSVVGDRSGILAQASGFKVKVIDSSGGGDAFLGGFIGALKNGLDLQQCLKRGNQMGARAVTKIGGQP